MNTTLTQKQVARCRKINYIIQEIFLLPSKSESWRSAVRKKSFGSKWYRNFHGDHVKKVKTMASMKMLVILVMYLTNL